MTIVHRFKLLYFVLIATYSLTACGGSLPASAGGVKDPDVNTNTVAFTGTVEAINGAEWTVNGQTVALDPAVLLEPGLAVGDEVRVEASVLADGSISAVKVESAAPAARPAAVGGSTRPDPANAFSPEVVSTPQVSSALDADPNRAVGEISGVVDVLTADSVIVNGVTYSLAGAKIKDVLAVGDRVRLHMTVHADGTLAVLEAEKLAGSPDSRNGPDDGPAHDFDDHSNHDSDHDDHDDDEHGNSNHD